MSEAQVAGLSADGSSRSTPGASGEPEPPEPAPAGARRPRPVFLVVGIALALALGIGLFTSRGGGSSGRPAVGGQAPGFSLPRLGGGGPVSPGHGHPVVLVFFASWCGPCQAELPTVAATYRHLQHAGGPLRAVRVVGIDSLDHQPAASTFVRTSGVSFPVGTDTQGTVANGLYGFQGLPEGVFIRADGTIDQIVYGPVTRSELLAGERRLVGS